MQKLTGYNRDELLKKNINILRSDLHDDNFFNNMWKTITSGKIWKGEIQNRKKSGEPYFEEMSITPLKNEHNEIVNYISIKEDITERKKSEIELKKAKDDAEKSDKLKSEFLAQMSHEIRTPINIISNFMQIYEDELKDKLTPELRNSISSVKSQSLRIITTIDSIINMAQLKTGTFNPKLQTLNLYSDVLKPSLDQWQSFANEKKLVFNSYGEPEDIFIKADLYSFTHALNHIVDNAIKYTDAGKVELEIKSVNDIILISISDTGNGISEEYLPHIFEPFSQEQQGYNRKYEGNGLGMALVKQYCQLNNVSISIESKKDKGTKVELSIPRTKKGG
jgi:PAS domain S-box-containing protein